MSNLIKDYADSQQIHRASQVQLVEQAVERLIHQANLKSSDILEQFDSLITQLEREIYRLYLEDEREYTRRALEAFFRLRVMSEGLSDVNSLVQEIGRSNIALDQFYLSLSQSRKSRAGSTFEEINRLLFRRLDFPFDEQPQIDGRPDFVMPSTAHYRRHAMDCLIFTAKRTLWERWRQIVTEGARGYGFFLATLDEKISAHQIAEMRNNRVFIVCPTAIKLARYSEHVNVLSYSEFFRDHVQLAQIRWKNNGVTP
ncbi:MAG: type II restriction endonuclease [Chloroflexota bacterium]|nr:type II restriction endonuclease [Chloroflexota bacterium]